MRRWAAFVLVAASLCAPGCALSTSKPAGSTGPPIGDACLVGKWTLQQDVNDGGYAFNNAPVSVSGLRGETVTFGPSGTEARVFDGSDPLVGSVGGRQLAIKIGGSLQFSIHANSGHFVETGAKTALPTSATLGGEPVSYQSYYEPDSGTYRCSATGLTMTNSSGTQTDTWSKG